MKDNNTVAEYLSFGKLVAKYLSLGTLLALILAASYIGVCHQCSKQPSCKHEVEKQKKLDARNCAWWVKHAEQVVRAECGGYSCHIRRCKPVQTMYMLAWKMASDKQLPNLVGGLETASHVERVTKIESYFRKLLKLDADEYVAARFCDKNSKHTRNVVLGNVVNVLLYPSTIKKAAVLFTRLNQENVSDARWKYVERRDSVREFLREAFLVRANTYKKTFNYNPGKNTPFYSCESFDKRRMQLEKNVLRGLATMLSYPHHRRRLRKAFRAVEGNKYKFEVIKVIEIAMQLYYLEWLEFKRWFPNATYPVYHKGVK